MVYIWLNTSQLIFLVHSKGKLLSPQGHFKVESADYHRRYSAVELFNIVQHVHHLSLLEGLRVPPDPELVQFVESFIANGNDFFVNQFMTCLRDFLVLIELCA